MKKRFDFYSATLGVAMDRTLQIAVRIYRPDDIELRLWERPVYQRHRNAEGHARNLTLKLPTVVSDQPLQQKGL